jgi:hypothetical protein
MLNMSEAEKADLAERVRAIVARTSWDITAEAMHKLIQTTAPGNRAQRLSADASNIADLAEGGNVSALPVKQAAAQAVDIDQPIKAQAAE